MSQANDSWKSKTTPSEQELKKTLSEIQYRVTQKNGTEPPFKNEYWDNKEPGIYVDLISGEPLFSSNDKFDSGTGWPSFTKPIDDTAIIKKKDFALLFPRTEIRSKKSDSHLGHLFSDGPPPTGQRYCMNSASLKFIALKDLEKMGYGSYKKMFQTQKTEKAILAGGCFWGVEELVRQLPGVLETVVGYTGGTIENPIYEKVKSGSTGHAEAIEIKFDPTKVSYEDILRYFFRLHDPTTLNRQGNDRGSQYRSAIFYLTPAQKISAQKIKNEVTQSGKWKDPVVTEITQATSFYPAEEYHQKYLIKNPGGYTCHYLRD